MGISIQVIRSSFELIKPVAKDVADRFYQNLFQDYPESKALFAAVDMQKQKIALIGALAASVENLDNPDALTRFLLALGEGHVRYGAEDIHYEWVGSSLLKTFGEFFGDRWSDDLRMQWTTVYNILAEAMKAGAKNAAKRTPKLRAVSAPQEREMPISSEQKMPTQLAEEVAAGIVLPDSLKIQIQQTVEATVLRLIKAEVQRCYTEQMRRIEQMSAEELVRLAR